MSVRSRRDGRSLVLELSGEVDLESAELLSSLREALMSDAERIVVDLSGLTYIGSVGIAALVRINAASRRDGNRLRFQGAQGQVARVLQLTGADREL